MDPIEKQQRKREARHRLIAQRRRAGLLRGRVVAVSLITFALLWAVVFVQMATGNDPVLGEGRPAAGATAARSERRTDSREASGAGAAAAEAIETTSPEESEPESVETQPVEVEPVEMEPEPEPAPVETAQS